MRETNKENKRLKLENERLKRYIAEKGDDLRLEYNQKSQDNVILCDSAELTKAVRPGDIISFNDGNFGAVVIAVDADNVRV